jgi:hypothetical protein
MEKSIPNQISVVDLLLIRYIRVIYWFFIYRYFSGEEGL